MNPSYRNNACSYLIGLHSFYNDPHAVLSADRNVRFDILNTSCSSGVGNVLGILYLPQTANRWTNAIHGVTGNVLLTDGSVDRESDFDVFKGRLVDSNGSEHFIAPP